MGKNIAKRAAGEVAKGSAAGWAVVILAAFAIGIACNPYGHEHHWYWMAIIFIIAVPLAAFFDHRKKKTVK